MRSSIATAPSSLTRPNEDFVAATDDLVIVLDGATTPGMLETGCAHGTRWFARALGAEIFGQLAPHPERPLADGLAEAIKALAERHSETCEVGHPGHPSATVVLIRETDGEYEYLVLGDSTAAFKTDSGVEVITDTRLDTVATEYHDALTAAPQGTSEHAEAFADLTTALRGFRNRPGGFWIAAVDPAAAYEAITGSIPRQTVEAAVALSDGASIVVDRFNLISWDQAFELLADAGPSQLIADVRAAESADAAGERWPRGKVHDDATAVYCLPG